MPCKQNEGYILFDDAGEFRAHENLQQTKYNKMSAVFMTPLKVIHMVNMDIKKPYKNQNQIFQFTIFIYLGDYNIYVWLKRKDFTYEILKGQTLVFPIYRPSLRVPP